MTSMFAGRPTVVLASISLVGILGCEVSSLNQETFIVLDSAGVRIVVSQGPLWAVGEGWSISTDATLEIGVLDGDERHQFDNIRGVTRLEDGRYAVLNGGDSELRFYDESGRFLEAVGGVGQGPGELNRPEALLRLSGDSLLVPTRANYDASWFTSQGEFVRMARLDAARLGAVVGSIWGCPRRPGLLPDGTFLACAGNGVERNQLEDTPRVSHWLVRVPYDVTWADTVGTVYGYSLALNYGAGATPVAAGGDPLRLFVGDPAFFEIDAIEDQSGRVLSIRYPNGLRPVGPSARERYDDYLREWEASLPPGSRYEPPEDQWYSATMPGFSDLHYDPSGYLWAIDYAPPWVDSVSALVFSIEGHLLGSVALPTGFEIHEIGPDYLLGIWRDELDVEYIRVYSLERE